jgi:hypothetical protein
MFNEILRNSRDSWEINFVFLFVFNIGSCLKKAFLKNSYGVLRQYHLYTADLWLPTNFNEKQMSFLFPTS